MIIGHGTIASVLRDREDRLYFASGVSNSSETRESEYQREKNLLSVQDRSQHIVYFSTLSVFYKKSRYTQHKLEMEALIKEFPRYTIVRLGNPVWGNNLNHLVPYLRNKIRKHEKFEIRDVYRYPLEKAEFLHWIDLIPEWNCEINVPGRWMKVKDIIKEYV